MARAALAAVLALFAGAPAAASELRGPGRFCGYSAIIDLAADERVVTLQGSIHSGSFRWEGAWGGMTVSDSELASPGNGKIAVERTAGGATRVAERRDGTRHVVAIGNGRSAAAWFSSDKPFTAAQLSAIDHVRLFGDGQAPDGCNLRTVFVWEFEE